MSGVAFKIDSPAKLIPALNWAKDMIVRGLRGGTVIVKMEREARTLPQNDRMWPMLTDISRQVEWFGMKFSPEDWKDLATGTFRKAKVVPNLDNTGFVTVGLSTRKMSKAEFSAFIDYLFAFGAEKGVQWSEQSQETINENKQEGAA